MLSWCPRWCSSNPRWLKRWPLCCFNPKCRKTYQQRRTCKWLQNYGGKRNLGSPTYSHRFVGVCSLKPHILETIKKIHINLVTCLSLYIFLSASLPNWIKWPHRKKECRHRKKILVVCSGTSCAKPGTIPEGEWSCSQQDTSLPEVPIINGQIPSYPCKTWFCFYVHLNDFI